MRVLGLAGSLRTGSHNARLLALAAARLPPGVGFERWTGLGEVPAYDEDAEPAPPLVVVRLREAVRTADAVLVATPEYNGSVPGALKNALDWVSRPYATNPLRGTPAVVIGASTGLFGAAWARADLERVLRTIGARVLDVGVGVPQAATAFTADGSLADPELDGALTEAVVALLAAAQQRRAA